MPPRFDSYSAQLKSGRLTGAAVTVLLHAGVVVLLLQFQPVRNALTESLPIMVSLITPVVEKPKEPPKPLPAKPQVKHEPKPEPALIAAPVEAPAPSAPAPQPVAPAAPPPPVEAPAPPRPLLVVPPSFNAAYLNNPPPVYPAMARRMGQQGKVVLRVLVDASGTPDKVEIRASSGHERLDDAALDAVRRWRFVPARQGDNPVAAWVLVPIVFTLEG